MDVREAITRRRSIRKFSSREVKDDVILSLIRSATYAPSEGNLQPWKFLIVKKTEIKKELTRAALRQRFIEEAPVVVVVCADLKRTSPYGERGRTLYCLQSTAAAIENLMLHATAEGLGTCWVGAFDEERVTEVLSLPPHLRPVAIIPIGYPAENPSPPPRIPLERVIEILK